MIIVSQNKRKIVIFDNLFNIDYYKIDGNFEIDANTENDSVCLGHYKTEERAKEVLEEIYSYRAIFEYFKYVPEDVKDQISEDFINDDVMFDIYEMPEE